MQNTVTDEPPHPALCAALSPKGARAETQPNSPLAPLGERGGGEGVFVTQFCNNQWILDDV